MKTQMSLLLVLSWLSIAVVHAAQPSGNDVSARVFNSADITVPDMNPGEWTSLTFNSERWDTANLHETATNSGRLKAPVAGKYYIFANITWESPIGTGLWGLRLQLNGKTVIAEQTLPNTGGSLQNFNVGWNSLCACRRRLCGSPSISEQRQSIVDSFYRGNVTRIRDGQASLGSDYRFRLLDQSPIASFAAFR